MAVLTLLPLLTLIAGAVLVRFPPDRLLPVRHRAGSGAAAMATAASLLLLWAVRLSPDGRLRLTLSPWGEEVFQGGLALDVDLLAAAFVLLISGLAWLVMLSRQPDGAPATDALLGVAAAGILFVAAGRVPLGLVAGWLALDVAIFVAAGGGRRILLTGQLGLLLLLAGLAALPPGTAVLSRLTLTELAPTVRFLLLAAGMIRMGLYPLWWAIPRSRPNAQWASPVTRLVPTLAGLYLVLRVTELTWTGEGLNTTSLLPALIVVALCGLLSWLADDRAEALDWQVGHHAALVIMAATLGGSVGVALALLFLFDLVLAGAVLYASENVSRGLTSRTARWVAVASLAGLPPTLGFAGRWLLYRDLLFKNLIGVLLVMMIASTLADVALWDGLLGRRAGGAARRAVTAATAVMGTALLLIALRFEILQAALAALTGNSPPSPLGDMLAMIRNPLTAERAIGLLAAILLPPIISAVMAWRRRGAHAGMGEAAGHLRRALRLTAGGRLLAAGLMRGGAVLHAASGLRTGRRDMAWTLVAVVVAAAALLSAAGGGGEPSPPPGVLPAVFLIGAAVVSGTLLLSTNPAITLAALGTGYVLGAALLALVYAAEASALEPGAVPGSAAAIIAIIKLLSGLLVVGVLAISQLQAPLDRRLLASARRLRRINAPETARTERLFPALALAVALVISYGAQSTSLPPGVLPTVLLQAAMVLAAGGVLTVVFAQNALHLASGVLLSLIGFELVYTRLDPGLLITGALAAFQLLFALVAAHFVGQATPTEPQRRG